MTADRNPFAPDGPQPSEPIVPGWDGLPDDPAEDVPLRAPTVSDIRRLSDDLRRNDTLAGNVFLPRFTHDPVNGYGVGWTDGTTATGISIETTERLDAMMDGQYERQREESLLADLRGPDRIVRIQAAYRLLAGRRYERGQQRPDWMHGEEVLYILSDRDVSTLMGDLGA